MREYNVRAGDNDSSYGTFSTLEDAARALRVVQRLNPEARIVVKYGWQARALMAEAQVQRVRDWLDNAGFPVDTETPYGQGYCHAMNDAIRALDGDSDE